MLFNRFNKGAINFVYLLIPILLFCFSLSALSNLPEVWAYYSDPSYAYLMNGLGVITGHPPNIIQHPGISMQIYIGMIIFFATLLQGRSNFIESVIQSPESYLSFISHVNFLILIIVFATLSQTLQKRYGFKSLLIFQLAFISCLNLFFPFILLAMPEFLVLISSFICLTIVLNPLFARSNLKSRNTILGFFLAVGIMSKVIFAPIILMVLIVAGVKNFYRIFKMFFIFLLLHLTLVFGRIFEMFSWFLGSSKSLNRYDAISGYSSEILFSNYQSAFNNLKSSLGYLIFLLFFTIAILLIFFIQKRITLLNRKILLGILTALGSSLLTGYKASAPRDFIVLGVLIPVLMALVFQEIQKSRLEIAIFSMCIIFLIPTLTWNVGSTVNSLNNNITDSEKSKADLFRVESIVGNSWLIGQYGLMTENAALQFGNNWAGSHFSKEISRKYPNAIEFNVWDSNFYYNNPESDLEILTCPNLSKLIGREKLFAIVLNLDLEKRLQEQDSYLNFSDDIQMEIDHKWSFHNYMLFEISTVRCNVLNE